MEKQLHIIENVARQERIDRALTSQFPTYSRNYIQQLICNEHVSLNGTIITKPSLPIKQGDVVEITFPPIKQVGKLAMPAEDMGVSMLYEHEDFLIVYKPAGLLVHAPNHFSETATLADWLVHSFKELTNIGAADRPAIVHRLDKDTSGLLVIPRTPFAHAEFGRLFQQRHIEKTYLALVSGRPAPTGTIDVPLGRHQVHKHKMAVVPSGRDALTHYKVLEYFADTALIEVHPVTGRTHQIRVHCADAGHPILGDATYGTAHSLINRQALHAHKLSFTYKGRFYSFWYDMPEDMRLLIDHLRSTR